MDLDMTGRPRGMSRDAFRRYSFWTWLRAGAGLMAIVGLVAGGLDLPGRRAGALAALPEHPPGRWSEAREGLLRVTGVLGGAPLVTLPDDGREVLAGSIELVLKRPGEEPIPVFAWSQSAEQLWLEAESLRLRIRLPEALRPLREDRSARAEATYEGGSARSRGPLVAVTLGERRFPVEPVRDAIPRVTRRILEPGGTFTAAGSVEARDGGLILDVTRFESGDIAEVLARAHVMRGALLLFGLACAGAAAALHLRCRRIILAASGD